MQLSNEHMRILDDLATTYESCVQAQRSLAAGPADARWRMIAGAEYLYEFVAGDARTSIGPRSAATENEFAARAAIRGSLEDRIAGAQARLEILASQYRALRLPRVDVMVGKICRAADLRGMLGTQLLVVGTNALPAYEIEAQVRFANGMNETQDCDFTWCQGAQFTTMTTPEAVARPFFSMLRSVDESFTVNMEKEFQARNRDAYEVELLMAPSLTASYPPGESIRPVPLPEQEWLLLGRPLRHVVLDRRNEPVPLHVPDPRWMALHKLWLSDKPGRNARKVAKDRAQGEAIARAVVESMPGYPIDAEFLHQVPAELKPYLNRFPQKLSAAGTDSAQFGRPGISIRGPKR